jgi:hypothetical protein
MQLVRPLVHPLVAARTAATPIPAGYRRFTTSPAVTSERMAVIRIT